MSVGVTSLENFNSTHSGTFLLLLPIGPTREHDFTELHMILSTNERAELDCMGPEGPQTWGAHCENWVLIFLMALNATLKPPN